MKSIYTDKKIEKSKEKVTVSVTKSKFNKDITPEMFSGRIVIY